MKYLVPSDDHLPEEYHSRSTPGPFLLLLFDGIEDPTINYVAGKGHTTVAPDGG